MCIYCCLIHLKRQQCVTLQIHTDLKKESNSYKEPKNNSTNNERNSRYGSIGILKKLSMHNLTLREILKLMSHNLTSDKFIYHTTKVIIMQELQNVMLHDNTYLIILILFECFINIVDMHNSFSFYDRLDILCLCFVLISTSAIDID